MIPQVDYTPPHYFVIPMLKGRIGKEPDMIIKSVCFRYGITLHQLKGKTRERDLVFARHLCMYLIRKQSALSYPVIGKLFDRDHTSVIHGIRSIEDYLQTNSLNRRSEIISFY